MNEQLVSERLTFRYSIVLRDPSRTHTNDRPHLLKDSESELRRI